MPQRKSTFRVKCEEVQGEDSFVVLHHIPYQLIGEARRKLADQTAPSAAENDAYVRELIRNNVVEWNWVNDAGAPLALPANVDDLMINEVQFLVKHITGSDQKN